uniref:GGDEF domain-containing protein n=1 Tax=Parerythrobacter lutipelagi TaxID=1964208 RepID=UPI0010F92B92|nr:GGDEF domain-containing protein [Parerythrobacter lutipelagi]
MRDSGWQAEVDREIVRSVLDRESSSLPASLLAWFVLVLAAIPLEFFALLLMPLGFRLASLLSTRWATQQVRKALTEHRSTRSALTVLTVILGVAGVSWAALLYPHATVAAPDPSVVAMRGIVVIGVAMVALTYGPLKWPMYALLAGFGLTLTAFVLLNGAHVSPWLVAVVVALVFGIATYSLGAARQQRRAAEMLVDNRFLSEELTDALAQAEFLSRHDPLTGLLNRRAFFETDIPPVDCSDKRFLLTVDLDHFKTVNDRHGHAVGDRLLVAAATVIRDLARPLDSQENRAVRLGGEEFVVLLVGIERSAAKAMAESLRRRIERIPSTFDGLGNIKLTASIGLTEYRSGEVLDDVLRRSDLAMYRAKERGRNRVASAAA